MKQSAREALEPYYQEAGSWAHDRTAVLQSSRRTAWIIAGVSVAVALFEAGALMLLAPLKTVVPYTLLVDRQTGYVQALKPIDADKIAPDAALTQSFLVQYVIARESFDIDALQANYRKAYLWSADRARNEYVSSVQVSNPESPLALYPRSTVVETRIRSVSSLDANTALVRFETSRRDANGRVSAARLWVAVIKYRYSQQDMTTEDRFINPLGFQVVRYNRNAETAPATEPEQSPARQTSLAQPSGTESSGAAQSAPSAVQPGATKTQSTKPQSGVELTP
jgi:type IV secretion system protein VirB8